MRRWRRELRRLTSLSIPLVLSQVGMNLLGFVDTMMVGRVGVDVLAAASLGHVWTFGTIIFAMGVVFGIDPIVTQAHGARDSTRLGLALQRGVIVAGISSIPAGLLWWYAEPALLLLGQSPELTAMTREYCRVQVFSVPFFLCFMALKQWLQGREIVRPAMIVMLWANLFNVACNELLIFGRLGFPELGIVGAGMATGLTRVVLMAALLIIAWRGRLFAGASLPWTRRSFRLRGLKEIFAIGIPFGAQYSLEVWAFQAALLLAGRLGEVALGAHTIVITLASMSFMFPFGISMAAVTRVGNLIGAGRPVRARLAGWVAMAMGGGVMLASAFIFVTLRHVLPHIFTDDPGVLALAATVMPIAAAFQFADGVQVVGGGVLRGQGSTRPAAVFNFAGYYGLALPLAWWLTFEVGLGLPGLWWGLAAALIAIAIALVVWIRTRPIPQPLRSVVPA